MPSTLTDKQQRFCSEYLVDYNATQAAIRAGYSKKTANEQASRLLTNVNIQNFLNTKKQKIEAKLELSVDRVKQELARVAFQDARLFFDENGELIPIHKLSDDAAAVIAGMDIEEVYESIGGVRSNVGVLKKIKRYDKVKALEMLAKHFKLFDDAPKASVTFNLGNFSPDELKALLQLKKKAA